MGRRRCNSLCICNAGQSCRSPLGVHTACASPAAAAVAVDLGQHGLIIIVVVGRAQRRASDHAIIFPRTTARESPNVLTAFATRGGAIRRGSRFTRRDSSGGKTDFIFLFFSRTLTSSFREKVPLQQMEVNN